MSGIGDMKRRKFLKVTPAYRVHPTQAVIFVRDIARGAATVADLPGNALHLIETLMQRYANLPMDLVDASLVVLAE